jgi:hypothetical protein
MSLNSALVDEARRVYQEQDPTGWNEDGPTFITKHGPWFRCRLTVHQPREQMPAGRGVYIFLEGDAELLFGVRDREGGFMAAPDGTFNAFDVDDQLEVVSADLGTRIWYVNTGPEPLRKKRRVIGYRVGLRMVSEPVVQT